MKHSGKSQCYCNEFLHIL